MRRLIFIIALILLSSPPLFSGNPKWFGSNSATALSAGTRYIAVFGGSVNNGTEASSHQVIAAGGSVKNLRVKVSVDPAGGGGTQSVTFALMVDAVASTLTCAVAEGDPDLLCADTSNTVAVTAGQRVSLRKTDANTPTLGTVTFMMEFDPTVDNETLLMGGSGGTSVTTGTRQLAFVGSIADAADASVGQRQIVLPDSGILRDLYIHFTAAVGADTTFTLQVDGADCVTSSIAVTILSAAQTGNETATDCAVTAGQVISLKSVTAGTPGTSVAFGIVFAPTTSGNFVIPYNSQTNIASAAAATYASMNAVQVTNATETNIQTLGYSDYRLTAVYISISAAPGASKSWDFALRENAGAPSVTFAATISGAVATTANVTAQNFTPTDNALYDTSITPTDTPANAILRVSYLGTMDSVGAGGAGSLLMMGVGK